MTKRMIIMLLLVVLVLGGVFGFKIFQGKMMMKYMAAAGAPAQTVSTSKATTQDWQPSLAAIGNIHAVNGAELSAELSGIVESIDFESDSDAHKGQILVHLRDEDDIAHLNSLKATAKLAEITFERDQKLLTAKAISQAAIDTDVANLANAAAQVSQQQAIIDKKTIRAPFAGHLGIREVNLGQYLNPGAPIVSLQQLDPIFIDFTLPENLLPQIQVGQKVSATIENDSTDNFEGKISAINSKVDESTRNIQVRATFKNSQEKLLPGMFANVKINVGAVQHFITLPQTVISFNPYGNTIFIIDSTNADKPVAKQSFVTTGETRGDQIAILTGVSEGDEVVTAGQLKLRNGSPVKINNEIQPTDNPNPTPADQ